MLTSKSPVDSVKPSKIDLCQSIPAMYETTTNASNCTLITLIITITSISNPESPSDTQERV